MAAGKKLLSISSFALFLSLFTFFFKFFVFKGHLTITWHFGLGTLLNQMPSWYIVFFFPDIGIILYPDNPTFFFPNIIPFYYLPIGAVFYFSFDFFFFLQLFSFFLQLACFFTAINNSRFVSFSVFLDDFVGQIYALQHLKFDALETALGLALLIIHYYYLSSNIIFIMTAIIIGY